MGCSEWLCIKPASGPMFYMAQACFLYTGFLKDTLFIRLVLVFGVLFITGWTLLGVPIWPLWINLDFPGIPLDALILGCCQVLVNGIPFLRQVTQNDKSVSFDSVTTDKKHKEDAEAMWRAWYQRSGVSRADFKQILSAGEWVMTVPGDTLPMWSSPQGGGKPDGTAVGAFGDTYYYIFSGKVECSARYGGNFVHSWNPTAGSFINNFTLLTLFGAAPGALAMQDGAISATVAKDSVVFAVEKDDDRSRGSRFGDVSGHGFDLVPKVAMAGALLFRWRRSDIMQKIVHSGCFAADAFHLLLSQSIMEGLFESVLSMTSPELGVMYHDLRRARMMHDLAPLPRNVKARKQKKPFLVQWRNSHGWPWNVSPKERAVNSLTCGSNELQRLAAMRDNAQDLQTLSRIFDAEVSKSFSTLTARTSRPSLAVNPTVTSPSDETKVGGAKSQV